MPNWMYNTLSISGEEAEISKVEKQLATPYERTTYDIGEDKYETRIVEKVISLWNIIKPDDLEAYEDNPQHDQTNPNHWYLWNYNNWGTKWDVSEAEMIDRVEGHISYQFHTPWGSPLEALITLSQQYPTLSLNLEFEEEQGWGGACLIQNGTLIETDKYEYKCHECDTKYQDYEQVNLNEEGHHQCETEEAVANA